MVSSRAFFDHMSDNNGSHTWGCLLWSRKIPPRRSILALRILYDRLPTECSLKSRGTHLASICHLCKKDLENPQHLFVDCDYVRFLWRKLEELFHSKIDCAFPLHELILHLLKINFSPQVKILWKRTIFSLLWTI